MEITLRQAAKSDLPAILSLYGQLGQDDGAILDREEAGNIWEKMGIYPDYRLYVALADDQVVGTFALLIMDNIAHCGARSAVLEDVVVEEQLRGRGVGRQMMRYAGSLCREKGCYKMTLSSNRNREAAHQFYESLGFTLHGYSFSMTVAATEIPAFGTAPGLHETSTIRTVKVERYECC
jgi:GNAT superfamily N-acetyltransferase